MPPTSPLPCRNGSLPCSAAGSLDLLLPGVIGCQWARPSVFTSSARIPLQGQSGWSHVPLLLSSPKVILSSPVSRAVSIGKMPEVIHASYRCQSKSSRVPRPFTDGFICNLRNFTKKEKEADDMTSQAEDHASVLLWLQKWFDFNLRSSLSLVLRLVSTKPTRHGEGQVVSVWG